MIHGTNCNCLESIMHETTPPGTEFYYFFMNWGSTSESTELKKCIMIFCFSSGYRFNILIIIINILIRAFFIQHPSILNLKYKNSAMNQFPLHWIHFSILFSKSRVRCLFIDQIRIMCILWGAVEEKNSWNGNFIWKNKMNQQYKVNGYTPMMHIQRNIKKTIQPSWKLFALNHI